MEPTGAYFLVALDADWNVHPKNQVTAVPATNNAAAVLASIRPRPIFTMPNMYGPQSTVYVRDLFKLEKELFERIDEAETTLHAAIVESLAPGTVRTINTSTPVGIASLSALQLVGLVHRSTLQYTYYARYQHCQRRHPTPDAKFRRFPRSHHRAHQPL